MNLTTRTHKTILLKKKKTRKTRDKKAKIIILTILFSFFRGRGGFGFKNWMMCKNLSIQYHTVTNCTNNMYNTGH